MFAELLKKIEEVACLGNFVAATKIVIEFVDNCPDFTDLLKQIGTIPESIFHDSSEEKLFSKASDAVLSRAFREIGLSSTVLVERADSADVIAKSNIHDYVLVADAKAFRMSRTAKNQKDFKVNALSGWKKDCDYAVLCSPYFQYPTKQSQIYAQAVLDNVCLLSWEHVLYLMNSGVKESEDTNLSDIWNYSYTYSTTCTLANRKLCFLEDINAAVAKVANGDRAEFGAFLASQIEIIKARGDIEQHFWINEIEKIKQYTREQAIDELIHSKNINGKIAQINSYVKGLEP